MNLKNVLAEIKNFEFVARLEEVIQTIYTASEEVEIMSDKDRQDWIDTYAFTKETYKVGEIGFFDKDLIDKGIDLEDVTFAKRIDKDERGLGRVLLRDFSPAEIYLACTMNWAIRRWRKTPYNRFPMMYKEGRTPFSIVSKDVVMAMSPRNLGRDGFSPLNKYFLYIQYYDYLPLVTAGGVSSLEMALLKSTEAATLIGTKALFFQFPYSSDVKLSDKQRAQLEKEYLSGSFLADYYQNVPKSLRPQAGDNDGGELLFEMEWKNDKDPSKIPAITAQGFFKPTITKAKELFDECIQSILSGSGGPDEDVIDEMFGTEYSYGGKGLQMDNYDKYVNSEYYTNPVALTFKYDGGEVKVPLVSFNQFLWAYATAKTDFTESDAEDPQIHIIQCRKVNGKIVFSPKMADSMGTYERPTLVVEPNFDSQSVVCVADVKDPFADVYATSTASELIEEEVLQLPLRAKWRQLRMPFRGKSRYLSDISLIKWSESSRTYEDAVKIMNEHLTYFTTIREDGVRVGNGEMFRATEAFFMDKYEDDLTTYTQQMGNYAYCVEETFFDLNHNFGNPEKLLGYFLGMGVLPNLLYTGEVNPYRYLCARLLGIDYAVNYSRLVKESIVRGYLFISSFEDGRIVPVNADVLLTKNWYLLYEFYNHEQTAEKITEIFGEETAPQVLNHHLDLLEKHRPERMEFADDSPEDYAQMLPQFGLGNVYTTDTKEGEEERPANQQRENKRITLPSYMPDPNITFKEVLDDQKLLRLASEKLTYEDFTKRESLERFYQKPVGLVDGIRIILSEGIMMSEADDKIVSQEPKRGLVKFSLKRPATPYSGGEVKVTKDTLKLDELREEYPNGNEWPIKNLTTFLTQKGDIAKKKTLKMPPKVSIKVLQEPYYWSAYNSFITRLESLGFELEEKVAWQGGTLEEYNQRVRDFNDGKPVNTFKVIPAKICRIIIERAGLIYKEIASYARVQGDELTSAFLATNKELRARFEDTFNEKYNGIPDVPIEEVPIFLENMKFFGGLKNIESVRLSSKFEKEGFTNASFSLREPQRLGLRFLGANGNSGLLAHEVGFGKTTSSIAKISDLFLRGDAKRVLVAVPKPVYDTGNWPAEIQGVKASNPSESANGLLPPYISLVQIGVMSMTDLRGKKMSIEADGDEYARLGEGSEYDGPRFYSKAELLAMEKIKPITDAILDDYNGANSKYGRFSFPYKESDSVMDASSRKDFLIRPLPLYKKSGQIDLAKIVRLEKDRKRWNPRTGKSENPYPNGGLFKGQKDDVVNGVGTEKTNFFVYLKDKFESEGVTLGVGEDGGAFKAIFEAVNRIASKYQKEYDEISQKIISIGAPKYKTSRLGGVRIISSNNKGTALNPNEGQITYTKSDSYERLRVLVGDREEERSVYKDDSRTSFVFNKDFQIVDQIVDDLKIILENGQEPSDIEKGHWPFFGHRGYYRNVVVPWASENKLLKLSQNEARELFKKDFPWASYSIIAQNKVAIPSPTEAVEIARDELWGILEQKMMTEILYLIKQLQKDIHLYLGHWKEWASQSNTIVLCAHPALAKMSSHKDESERASMFMNGFYDKNDPEQKMFLSKKGNLSSHTSNKAQPPFTLKDLSQTQRQIQLMAQFRGMNISELGVDCLMVDEAHNFNRAFKKPQKGSMRMGVVRQAFGSLSNKTKIVYDTFANYNIRNEVHNFISICFYFQKRADKISQRQTRKLQNTIFLTATPFTDDNFQMISLFGALSTEKLYRSGVYSLFDFFRLYVNEIWRKDIDYQGRYGLTPKIESYKNVYSMSQLIRSFTNFQISSKEIDAKRPQKIPLAVEDIVIDGNRLSAKGQVGFNDAQLKMNQYLNDFVTLKSDYEIQYTEDELKQALELYDSLEEKRGKEASKGNKQAEIKKLKRLVGKESEGFPYEPENEELVNETIDAILALDSEDEFANKVVASQFFSEDDEDEIKKEEGEEGDEEEEALAGSVLSDIGSDELQIIAQRALASSMKQTLALVTPYYLTINNDKRLMNPLLPPLNGTASEDAKNVIENSPKLLYACKAIAMMLEFGLDEKKQTYQGEGPNRLFGQVVFIRNYNFIYHGIRFNIFDLMIQYIIDNNKDLLERAVGKDVDLKSLFATIDSRTRKYKDKKTGQIIDEKTEMVNRFNNGGVLVLFGGETIKEGINLQKNCPLMYILEMGFVPVVYMQLHGRIWRQGNPYKYAFLINVLTQNSIDTFTYSKLEEKVTSVKNMLEGDVYDANTTQFDVDVSEIKRSLITDPEKLAEMRWSDMEEVLDRQRTKTENLIENLDRVQAEYPEARRNYDAIAEFITIFTKAEAEMYGPAKMNEVVRQENESRRASQTYNLATKKYVQQFVDAGLLDAGFSKDDFQKAEDEFYDARYDAKEQRIDIEEINPLFADFKTKYEIKDELEPTYELQDPATLSDILEALNNGEYVHYHDEIGGATKLVLQDFDKKALTLDGSSPSRAVLNGFMSVKRSIYHAVNERVSTFREMLYGFELVVSERDRIGEPSLKKVINSLSLEIDEDGYVVPIGKEQAPLVKKAIIEFEKTKDFEKSWADVAVQVANVRKRSYLCYPLTLAYRRFGSFGTDNPIAIMPDDSRVIDLYEDSIASVMIDGVSATIDDIDKVREKLTSDLEEIQRKLGDSFGQKKILEEEERIEVEKRQGAIIPSVDEMVESLKQLQPYIQRRDEK